MEVISLSLIKNDEEITSCFFVRCCPVLSKSISVWVAAWVYPRTAKSNPIKKL